MPGFLAHPMGAQVLCSHAGQTPTVVPNPRVLVSGQPTLMMNGLCTVAGCALPPPPGANGPCVSAPLVASTRVFSNSVPLVVLNGPVQCVPTGTPLLIDMTSRVTAT